MSKRLIKVQFFFDDGSSKFLENEEAEKWSRWNNNLCQIASFHGQNPEWSELDWKYMIEDLDKYQITNLSEEC